MLARILITNLIQTQKRLRPIRVGSAMEKTEIAGFGPYVRLELKLCHGCIWAWLGSMHKQTMR